MSLKDSALEQAISDIKTLLDKISTENDYNFSPTVAEGWLRHYFSDLSRVRTPTDYPVVLYRPELSTPSPKAKELDNAKYQEELIIAIDAAVQVFSDGEPVRDLLKLLKDVRRAVVFPEYGHNMKIQSIELLACDYDVPETGDAYAFFTQKIRVIVNDEFA